MKSFFRIWFFIFPGLVWLVCTGCLDTSNPTEPLALDNRLSSNEFSPSLDKEDQSSLLAETLGIEKLYIAPFDADSAQKIEDPSTINFILSLLSENAVKELLEKRAIIVNNSSLIDAFSTLVGYHLEEGKAASWLISFGLSLGCFKACYSDEIHCTPCPECCDEDHVGKNPNNPFD